MLTMLKKVTACAMILCLTSLCWAVTAPAASTATLAAQLTSQGVTLANGQFTGVKPTAAQLNKLAATYSDWIEAASNDGSLAKFQANMIANGLPEPTDAAITAETANLQANGWLGTKEDIETSLANITAADRAAILQQVKTIGLKALLLQTVADLRSTANDLSKGIDLQPSLNYAAFHNRAKLRRVMQDCHGFAVGISVMAVCGLMCPAVGVVAALGGVIYAVGCA